MTVGGYESRTRRPCRERARDFAGNRAKCFPNASDQLVLGRRRAGDSPYVGVVDTDTQPVAVVRRRQRPVAAVVVGPHVVADFICQSIP